jgi:glutamine amidotransferase
MCRLFGFRSAVPSRAHRSLIAARNALAEQAREHPHGWGIGYFQGGEAYVLKSERAAATCESFRRAADHLASHALIAHVRRATVGGLGPLNVHPFRSGRWIFAHNGTIFGFDKLRRRMLAEVPEPLRGRVLGTTDSEVLLYYLLGGLVEADVPADGHGEVAVVATAQALADRVSRVDALAAGVGAKRPVMNFLLTNGDVFIAHRQGRELYFSTQKVVCRDSETCREPDKVCLLRARPHARVNHLLVASERIGEDDVWEELPEGGMALLARDFRLHFRSPDGRIGLAA